MPLPSSRLTIILLGNNFIKRSFPEAKFLISIKELEPPFSMIGKKRRIAAYGRAVSKKEEQNSKIL